MSELAIIGTQNTIQQARGRDLYAEFISFIDASPETVKTYSKALRGWATWTSEREITNPTRDDVIAYRDELKATHKAATVNLYLGVVKLFFQWLGTSNIYPNVAAHIKGAKLAAGFRKDYLTSGAARAILTGIERNDIEGLRDYAILALMVTCGLRTVEVIRANIEDMRTLGDSRVLYVQGKGHAAKDDLVKIPATVEAAIMAYLKAAGTPEEGQPLFRSNANRNKGDRLTTRSVSRIAKERMRTAGYDSERLTAHSLRHTAATLMLINGASLQETQQVMRHKAISTTTIYSHNLERMANDGENRVADAIFNAA